MRRDPTGGVLSIGQFSIRKEAAEIEAADGANGNIVCEQRKQP
jgi:hypothetical protein